MLAARAWAAGCTNAQEECSNFGQQQVLVNQVDPDGVPYLIAQLALPIVLAITTACPCDHDIRVQRVLPGALLPLPLSFCALPRGCPNRHERCQSEHSLLFIPSHALCSQPDSTTLPPHGAKMATVL
jgi:hypothetical protein